MTKKPKPIKFITAEGGMWPDWREDKSFDRSPLFAVMFEDGSVFDRRAGWRDVIYCPCCGQRTFFT